MNVLIADDHIVVREGLKQIIKKINGISSIEEAGEGYEVLTKLENNKYDFVILDVSMPGLSGMDILKTLQDRNETAHILVLSMHSEEQYAMRAMRLGASGYLCKDSIYDELELAINKIAAGGKYISSWLAEKVILGKQIDKKKLPHETLSDREFQIMCMIAKGKSVKDIASELFISDKTVSTHRMRILIKMDMKTSAELMHYAIKNNIIE